MITPEQLAKSETEHGEQAALFCWAANKLNENPQRYAPLRWLFAIPNGGERNKATAGRLKAEGVKSGVSDVFLPWPKSTFTASGLQVFGYAGLFVELKADGGRLSKEQSEFLHDMHARGYQTAVAYGWKQAVEVIEKYLG